MAMPRNIIFKWITSQEWFNEFNKELIKQRGINFCAYLYAFDWNGIKRKYESLINFAFTWMNSSLGVEYWAKIDRDFNSFLRNV